MENKFSNIADALSSMHNSFSNYCVDKKIKYDVFTKCMDNTKWYADQKIGMLIAGVNRILRGK